MDASSSGVDLHLEQLKSDVEHHVHEEESEAFPKLRDAIDQSTLQQLADEVRAAKAAV